MHSVVTVRVNICQVINECWFFSSGWRLWPVKVEGHNFIDYQIWERHSNDNPQLFTFHIQNIWLTHLVTVKSLFCFLVIALLSLAYKPFLLLKCSHSGWHLKSFAMNRQMRSNSLELRLAWNFLKNGRDFKILRMFSKNFQNVPLLLLFVNLS